MSPKSNTNANTSGTSIEIPPATPTTSNDDNVDLGYEEEDRSELSRVRALVRLIIGPLKYYNLFSLQGRRQYCDLITEEPLGPLIRWIPLIVLMVLVNVHTTIALWIAFGLNFGQCLFERYHSTYKPQYPAYYWLSVSQTIASLAMAVVDLVLKDGIDPNLVSPIVYTLLLLVTILSMVVGIPFTKQMAQHKVSTEIRNSEMFHKLSMTLTFVWVVIFGIASIASWVNYALIVGDESNKAVSIIVGTVVPLGAVFGGVFVMQPIANYLKTLYGGNDINSTNNDNNNSKGGQETKTSKNTDDDDGNDNDVETGL